MFISSDTDANAFAEYYKEMPWLALPFENAGTKQALNAQFEVSGIPTLVILDGKTGAVLNMDASVEQFTATCA